MHCRRSLKVLKNQFQFFEGRFSTSFLDQFQKEDPTPHLNLSSYSVLFRSLVDLVPIQNKPSEIKNCLGPLF